MDKFYIRRVLLRTIVPYVDDHHVDSKTGAELVFEKMSKNIDYLEDINKLETISKIDINNTIDYMKSDQELFGIGIEVHIINKNGFFDSIRQCLNRLKMEYRS